MPKRPRSHVLEAESRRRFQTTVLPAEWVSRAIQPDYGLDDVVEIFENGEATGLEFRTQVRATDEVVLSKALILRFEARQWAYFAAQTVPVLLVRYNAPTGRFFARWFHRVETTHHNADSSTLVRLSEADEVDATSRAALLAEVRAVRQLKSPVHEWPITIAVKAASSAEFVLGRSAAEWASIFAAVGGAARYVRYRALEQGPPVIEMTDKETTVHFALTSVTLHNSEGVDQAEVLGRDVTVATALCLGNLGQFQVACELVADVGPASRVITDPDIAFRVAGFFVGARRVAEGLRFGTDLRAAGHVVLGRLFLSTVMLENSHLHTDADNHAIEQALMDEVDRAHSDGDTKDEARAKYSLGNWLFARGRYDHARASYEQALVLAPRYKHYEYFCGELAAAMFETGAFEEAAQWYRKAIDVGTEPVTHACQGDALMHAGRYVEALDAFRAYRELTDVTQPWWALTEIALAFIVEETGLNHQTRDRQRADEFAAQAALAASPEERTALIRAALDGDALCGHAWFLRAADAAESGDAQAAAMPILRAALEAREPEIWAEATRTVLWAGRVELAELVLACARRDGEDAFIDAIRHQTSNLPRDVREEFVQGIQQALDDLPSSEDERYILRIHGSDTL